MALYKIEKDSSGTPQGYERVAGGILYADVGVGTIIPFGGASDKIPQGFLLCNGSEVLKTDYAELYAVIGDAFGTASVNTKFVLPDLRGKFAEGTPSGGTLGQSKSAGLPDITGTASGSLKWNELHSMSGAFKDSPVISSNLVLNGGNNPTTGVYALDFKASKSNSIYGSSNTVQPPAVCVNYIIKAKMVALPADFMSAVEEAIDENAKSPVSVSNKLVTESDLNAVTSGNATRNTTYVSSTGFNATWNKTGRVCMASLKFNLAQNTTSIEEIITGFPAPIVDVNIVAQGDNNTAVSNLVLKTNGNIRTHYGGTANQFYQVTFTYITAS